MSDQVPKLEELAVDALLKRPDVIRSLQGVPEELVLLMLDALYRRGRMTPRLLKVFLKTESEEVDTYVKKVGLSMWTPPILRDDGHHLYQY